MSDEDIQKIGNGSVAHIKVNQYNTKKYGEFVGLGSIKVIDIKEYSGDSDFGDDDDVADAAFDNDDEDLI